MGVAAGIMVPHPPVLVPEVGGGREAEAAATAAGYEKAAVFAAECRPDTLFVISPHSTAYADYFHISPGRKARGSFASFGAPGVVFEVSYDWAFASELEAEAGAVGLPAGTLGERDKSLDHGVAVPLYFLRRAFGTLPKIVRMGVSGLPLREHYRLGALIARVAERMERRVLIVASGDLSHHLKDDGPYGFTPEGPQYDGMIMDVMGSADFGKLFDFGEVFRSRAGECGHRSFAVMAGAFDGLEVEAERLSYEGPFGVGYGVCTFRALGPSPARRFLDEYAEKERRRVAEAREAEDSYVRLARAAAEAYARRGETLRVPPGLPDEMYSSRAGVFVSIKKDGQLRGCIGTTEPARPSVAQEIIYNAISASSRDPRFEPVEPEELDSLVYNVDVLSAPEPVDSPSMLDVKKYGVIVSKGGRRGLLLPDLEGVDSVEEQISIAKRKAGIAEGEKASLERFEVKRHR